MSSAAAAAATTVTSSGPKRAIIVGGGIGGLVTAGRLAKEGFSVTLLEQNEEVWAAGCPVWVHGVAGQRAGVTYGQRA